MMQRKRGYYSEDGALGRSWLRIEFLHDDVHECIAYQTIGSLAS